MEVVKTVCNLCTTRCGINVYVEDGKIVNVTGMQEHQLNSMNTLCEKGRAIPELVYSPERLTNPLRRINGELKEVSWDDALGFIVDKLADIKQKYGAKAVNVHVGYPFIETATEKLIRRFTDLYSTPNFTSGGAYCWLSRTMAHTLTVGAHCLPHYSGDTRCMILWGHNPVESSPLEADSSCSIARRGAKLIVIDPRVIPQAKAADIYTGIRPGTDGALALGLLNVIIAEELYDKEFVENWTVGFDKLVENVKEYTPQRVEEITWVPADTVKNIARMYATNKPAYISLGISIEHHTNGLQAARAVSTLMAITGNIEVTGGNVATPSIRQTWLRLEDKVTKDIGVGAKYPLYTKYSLEENVVPAIDQMLTEKPYPLKGLLITGCNPIVTWPNTNKLIKAFKKLDLLMVVDIFLTDTAKMADVVLPGTTCVERQDLRTYPQRGLPLIVRTERVIPPIGNSMQEWKIWAELGKRMGWAEYFPWENDDELFEYLLESTHVSLDQLKAQPGGIYYQEREFKKYLKDGFRTPSKKVEIYSEIMEKYGYEPLPTFHEPAESPISRPDLAEEYPLTLITGPRTIAYVHSQCRNLPSLRKMVPEPLIEMHPETAANFGILDKDMVLVESLRGSIKVRAKITEDILPKLVAIQHGWSGDVNVNFLTDDEALDPVSGFPGLRSVLVRVKKVAD